MQKFPARTGNVNRIIDVNLNRAKEGLRVCEEVSRFILDSRALTLAFKGIRHRISSLIKCSSLYGKIIQEREAAADIGRKIYKFELSRKSYQDIFFANIQRVKESLRVLEEFSKLNNRKAAMAFKELRYEVYQIEKRVAEKFTALRHYR